MLQGDICKRKIALVFRYVDSQVELMVFTFKIFTSDLSTRLVRVMVRALPVFKLAPIPESFEVTDLQQAVQAFNIFHLLFDTMLVHIPCS